MFEGSYIQMKGSYYTYDPEQQAVDQFQETTDKLIEIVCSSFKEPQLLKACIKDFVKQTIPEPQLQSSGTETITQTEGTTTFTRATATRQDELKYSSLFKEWQYTVKALDDSLS